MFKIKHSDTFKWPVSVKMPADGGKFTTHTFTAEFKRATAAELVAFKDRIIAGNDATLGEILRDVVVGWADVQDADGNDMPFSTAALDDLLQFAQVQAAMFEAFTAANAGEARRKN